MGFWNSPPEVLFSSRIGGMKSLKWLMQRTCNNVDVLVETNACMFFV